MGKGVPSSEEASRSRSSCVQHAARKILRKQMPKPTLNYQTRKCRGRDGNCEYPCPSLNRRNLV